MVCGGGGGCAGRGRVGTHACACLDISWWQFAASCSCFPARSGVKLQLALAIRATTPVTALGAACATSATCIWANAFRRNTCFPPMHWHREVPAILCAVKRYHGHHLQHEVRHALCCAAGRHEACVACVTASATTWYPVANASFSSSCTAPFSCPAFCTLSL